MNFYKYRDDLGPYDLKPPAWFFKGLIFSTFRKIRNMISDFRWALEKTKDKGKSDEQIPF